MGLGTMNGGRPVMAGRRREAGICESCRVLREAEACLAALNATVVQGMMRIQLEMALINPNECSKTTTFDIVLLEGSCSEKATEI